MSAASGPTGKRPRRSLLVPVTEDVFVCGGNTYTITCGAVSGATHEGCSASGNFNGIL